MRLPKRRQKRLYFVESAGTKKPLSSGILNYRLKVTRTSLMTPEVVCSCVRLQMLVLLASDEKLDRWVRTDMNPAKVRQQLIGLVVRFHFFALLPELNAPASKVACCSNEGENLEQKQQVVEFVFGRNWWLTKYTYTSCTSQHLNPVMYFE